MASKILIETVLDNPEALSTMVSYEMASVEEIESVKRQYELLLTEIEKEWTPKRIKDFIVERKRWLYKRSAELIQKTELENRDARMKGVSYKDRKRFTSKIKAGYSYVADIKKAAHEAKIRNYEVRSLIRPRDVSLVERFGFQGYLELFY